METSTIEVLVFEGSPARAEMIREMLAESRKPAFAVQHVGYLAEGLGQLASRTFDIILVDLGLPDSQGLETALVVLGHAKRTPIVVMTVLDDEETAQKALQLDIQDYLIKEEITGRLLKRSIRYAMQRKRDMEACLQCEQRFASFMNHLSAAAWIKDLQGRYVYANAENERIFSRPFSEYSGKRDEEFLQPETARQLRENDERVLAGGESLQTVEILRQADGLERHFIVSKFPIPDPGGQPAYVAGIALDITERERAEEALHRTERKFTRIFQSVPALVFISTLEEGRFADVNDTAMQSLGYRREEMIGRTALELDLWENMSDRAKMLQELEERGAVRNIEVRLRGKGGQSLVGLFSAECIELEGNRYMLGLVKDITERIQAEEALRFSEARFRILHDDNPAMIFTLDTEGRIISSNPACRTHLGYSSDELAGQPVLKIFHEDERPMVAKRLQMCLRHPERVHHWQSRKIRKDGGLVWVEELVRVIHDVNGALNIVVVCQDVTERKRAEAALQKTEWKLRNIIENSTNLFYMHSTDHTVTYISPQSRQFFDCEPDETLGRSWTKFLTDTPVNRAAVEATQHAIDTGERQPLFQAEAIGQTGRKIWVEVNESPVVKDGKTVAIVGSLTNITERKRAEDALRKSEKKFSKVFHEVPALLVISTLKEGRYIDVNDMTLRTLGYRRDEVIGRSASELNIWEDLSERSAIVQALEKRGSVKNVEVRLRGKRGQTLIGLFSAEYIDFNGDRYMLSLVEDITLKRRAQEKVERLNAELTEVNRIMADDLEAMKILQKIGMLFLHEESLEQILAQVLEAAITISGANFGNIQTINPQTSGLQIAVQHGFPQWWLDYWNQVVGGKGVCGTALGRGERVIVEDIEHSPIFSDPDALEIQLKAGVRAVQSTPLVSRSGSLLGMFSTHYRAPHRPSDRELRLLDLLARHAADFIEEARLREMLEARVQQSEERFAAFMSHLPVAAWMKDLTGRYVYVNAEEERLFSRPFAELSGKTDRDLLPPETARQFRENDERVVAEGKTIQATEVVLLPDGIEHHYIVSKFTVPGPDGRAAYVAGIAQDITERMKAEEALRFSEERFRALVTASSQVLYRMSPDWSEMRQLSSREVLASTEIPSSDWLQKYIHPEDQPNVTAAVQHAIRTKSMFEAECRVRRPDGGLAWTLSRAVPLLDAKGEIIEWFGAANDITERVEAEKAELAARATELEDVNRELEAFNYTVAHDLRKPLATINGYCQIIRELCGERLSEECSSYLQETYDGTWRMSRLIDALLDFSRASRVEPRREKIDLSGLARTVAGDLKHEPARRVRFLIMEGIEGIGDVDLLQVVLTNLIGNAWKYTAQQEEAIIEFGVTQVGEEMAYFVRDNGLGFAMADAERLFIPFQRMAGNGFAGHGIGLATVERIIRRHGGRIWAAGEPGKGATFYFTLPNMDKASH